MERIFLIGYMGAGKTTVGKVLAKQRGLDFIDLDLFIEARYQKSVGQIFEELGEEKFREVESSLLKEVADFEDVLISTGGGTPCYFDNMEYMNRKGITVYLKYQAESLAKRLNKYKEKRPLLKGKDDNELYKFVTDTLEKRQLFYNSSHIIFDMGEFKNNEEISKYTSQLVNMINTFTKENEKNNSSFSSSII